EEGGHRVDVLLAVGKTEGDQVVTLRWPREEMGLGRPRLVIRVVDATREQRDRDESQILSVVVDLRKEGVEEDEAHLRLSFSRATFRNANGRDPGRPRPSETGRIVDRIRPVPLSAIRGSWRPRTRRGGCPRRRPPPGPRSTGYRARRR